MTRGRGDERQRLEARRGDHEEKLEIEWKKD
jgi:hypothetical protein